MCQKIIINSFLFKLKIKQFYLQSNEYIHEKTIKDKITFHLADGGPNAHWLHSTFEYDRYQYGYSVAIAYGISGFDNHINFPTKDGEIFEFFNPDFWAYHVNMSKVDNCNNIGIEICNRAILVKKGNSFVDLNTGVEVPPKEVEEIKFRGYQYWHRITDSQLESAFNLIQALRKKHPLIDEGIRKQKFDESWSDYNPSTTYKKGVFCHTNFKPAPERFDLPPFPRFLEMLNSL